MLRPHLLHQDCKADITAPKSGLTPWWPCVSGNGLCGGIGDVEAKSPVSVEQLLRTLKAGRREP